MRWPLTLTAFWLVLLSTLNPAPALCQPVNVTMPAWLSWVKVCAAKYNVDPCFALAVAQIESGTKGQRFRFGKLGKGTYYGPFGIHKSFLKKWRIDDPMVNTEIGIKALRGPDQRRVLKRYNKSFNEGYYRAVMATARQYRRSMF